MYATPYAPDDEPTQARWGSDEPWPASLLDEFERVTELLNQTDDEMLAPVYRVTSMVFRLDGEGR